ncbi:MULTISPECIES: hypothetical protein [Nocardioides]|uniref:Uncharacterized protein n=1 Tax=Nocardioides vastitatis TaxID=2568655 RepID=A0ABW0ZH99_9ACTN|nr:hypothetical protein [Nocardioides sp.]THJ08582.1 hypothetical protein E7Z54_03865 [Nocardioides sp.]
MEILFWLVPAAVVTLTAMVWVGWWGREGRGAVDRETAARKLGEALTREQRRRPGYAAPRRTPERSTGVALRPSKTRPVVIPGEAGAPAEDAGPSERSGRDRRAS